MDSLCSETVSNLPQTIRRRTVWCCNYYDYNKLHLNSGVEGIVQQLIEYGADLHVSIYCIFVWRGGHQVDNEWREASSFWQRWALGWANFIYDERGPSLVEPSIYRQPTWTGTNPCTWLQLLAIWLANHDYKTRILQATNMDGDKPLHVAAAAGNLAALRQVLGPQFVNIQL